MAATTEKPTVLVIEDEEMLNRSICDTLADDEITVYSSFSGEDALDMLKELQIDICTVDMRLKGMTGNEFITKAHQQYPHLKFIIYTGSANYSIPRHLRSIGIKSEHTFSKPLGDLMILAETIKKLHATSSRSYDNQKKDSDH